MGNYAPTYIQIRMYPRWGKQYTCPDGARNKARIRITSLTDARIRDGQTSVILVWVYEASLDFRDEVIPYWF